LSQDQMPVIFITKSLSFAFERRSQNVVRHILWNVQVMPQSNDFVELYGHFSCFWSCFFDSELSSNTSLAHTYCLAHTNTYVCTHTRTHILSLNLSFLLSLFLCSCFYPCLLSHEVRFSPSIVLEFALLPATNLSIAIKVVMRSSKEVCESNESARG